MDNSGLLVVRRGNWLEHDVEYNKEKSINSSIPFSYDEINKKYRGIEGLPWPEEDGLNKLGIDNGLAPIRKISFVIDYFQKVSLKYLSDFIFISFSSDEGKEQVEVPGDFYFLGIDYGNYISEYNYYSSLLNEVVWGGYEEMRSYSRFLNEYLLFSELNIIEKINNTRNELIVKGADLEKDELDEKFGPIMIWGNK